MVHRATFRDDSAKFEKENEKEEKFEESALLECFPPNLGNNLLLIFGRWPRQKYWSFLNVEAERHNNKREKIKGIPTFDPAGWSEAVVDLYEIPPSANEADFKAEFTYAGEEWEVRFKGNQIHP